MDVFTLPQLSSNWLKAGRAAHASASGKTIGRYYTRRKPSSDLLERLKILSAVCRSQGQYDQSMQFDRERAALLAKLNQPAPSQLNEHCKLNTAN